ncbi:MAG: AI-2E family transporter [Chitinophagaceae bacterium]|nr:AI-2E family transporter [Oligoflexus sp.]
MEIDNKKVLTLKDQAGQSMPPNLKVDLNIPIKTVFKLLAIALLVYALIALTPIIVTIFVATMVAVTLHPLILQLESRRFPSWVGLSIVVCGIFLSLALIFTMILPPLIEQGTLLMNNMPELKQSVLTHIPQSGPLHEMATSALSELAKTDASKIVTPLVSFGQIAIGGFAELFLIFIFTIYLLADGPRALRWVLDFFSVEKHDKLKETASETSKVISAYVAGQLITCLICGAYTLTVLSILHVPAALMLATIAAVFDILPVLGFFLAAVPAVILGLTISPLTGVLVVALYILYHALENYILIPKIYGNRLRLSDLVVLTSLIAAGTLGGIIGAIVILPLVASYPIIERIWLVDYLGKGVVKKHHESTPGRDESKTFPGPDQSTAPSLN